MYRVWIYFYSLMSCTLIIILCYYRLIKKFFAKNTHRALIRLPSMLPARNYLYRFQLHHIATQIFFISNRSMNTKNVKSMRIYFSLLQQFCNAVGLRWIIYDWLIHMFGITLWWSIYILIDPSNFLQIIHLYSVYYYHLWPLES